MCKHKFIDIHTDYTENSIMDTAYIIKWCELCGSYREDIDDEVKLRRGTLHYPESIRLYDLAKMYEEIEVDMLNHDGYWFDTIPNKIYDKMMKAQALRNQLLYSKNEEAK